MGLRAWWKNRRKQKAREIRDWGLLPARRHIYTLEARPCESREELEMAIKDLEDSVVANSHERNEWMEKYYDLLNDVQVAVDQRQPYIRVIPKKGA